jgi:hypothetical protein
VSVAVDSELQVLAGRLAKARRPDEIFGDAHEAKRTYRRLAWVAHPDPYESDHDREAAEAAFRRLNALWSRAERAIRDGSYARAADPLELRTRHRAYTAAALWRTDEISNHYHCEVRDVTPRRDAPARAVLRVVRNPRDNDLLANERTILRHLHDATEDEFRAYLPTLLDSVGFKQPDSSPVRRVNAFSLPDDVWSLEAVVRAYPIGIDPKDAAWIFRRLLVAIGLAHRAGVVHGGVLPTSVLIQPELHGLVLVNWSYAVQEGPVRALNRRYRDFYPQEVLDRKEARPETDVFLAARTMIAVMGGVGDKLPSSVPSPLRTFLRGCTLPAASRRPDDAWRLKDSFDEVLERVWGPRRFHPFAMPASTKEG